METVDISLLRVGLLYLFLLIPIVLFYILKLPLIKSVFISVFRMSVQLVLVGLYLGFIFEKNSIILNSLWLFIMVTVAASHTVKSSKLKRRELFSPVLLAILISLVTVLIPFITVVISPYPLYDARYLIPLGGMLLGNFLSANIVALGFYSGSLKERKQELQSAFVFGATRFEAVLPFLREAFRKSIVPTITTIGTLGLVSLPGMMTGQLLGGSVPVVAIKYQIAIMVAILSASSLSIFLTLLFVTPKLFDQRGNIRLEVFRD